MLSIFLILIIFLSVAIFFKLNLPTWKGQIGEAFTSTRLHTLDEKYYKILNNLMIPSYGNTRTTQIDHVVVSNFGIFCIETKMYKGWIFGNSNQEYWTQIIYKYKKRFYNPIKQNFAHTNAIGTLLGAQRLKAPIISLIAFPSAEKLRVSGTDSVGGVDYILSKIKNYTNFIYSDPERDEIFNLLISKNILDDKIRENHSKEVSELKDKNY
jgi:hypothetical protein